MCSVGFGQTDDDVCSPGQFIPKSLTALGSPGHHPLLHPHRFAVSLNVTFAERGHTARLEHHPPDVILSPWGTRVLARPSAFGP